MSALLAIVITPYLLVRNMRPRADALGSLAFAGIASVALNTFVAVACHLGGIAFVRQNLAVIHWVLFAVLILVTRIRGLDLNPGVWRDAKASGLTLLCFAVLVLPFTHLTGIDTYKWQDLATAVQADRCIPWFVHPVSLLGYSPRSYPSAQPLVLATVQTMGRLGVDWGYYAFSVLSAAIGILGIALLGRRVCSNHRTADFLTVFYAFSMVFVRYNHWATGRGLLLALLPCFLLSIVTLPRPHSWAGLAVMTPLLLLSHKAGAVAVVVILGSLLLAPLLRLPWPRTVAGTLVALSLCVALAVSPCIALPSIAGRVLGFIKADLTRFGWMLPLMVIGAVSVPHRRLLPILAATFPLAHIWDMYGALIALPPVAFFAAEGATFVSTRWPRIQRYVALLTLTLTALGAVAIVVHRSRTATPDDVFAVAQFLESHDPGPYIIDAPGDARSRIQAYVSGCPRFSIARTGPVHVHLVAPPPILRQDLRRTVTGWTAYLRNALYVSGIDANLYGRNPRTYHVVIDGRGTRVPGRQPLFTSGNVELYSEGERP